MAAVAASNSDNNSGCHRGGGGGGGGSGSGELRRASTVQQQMKQQRSSNGADHTKVIFNISREAVERLMLYHQHSFAQAMAGLDVALNMYVEFFSKDLVFPMQSPILFRKLDMKRHIRAALTVAAKDVSGEIERITRIWSVEDKLGIPAEDARKLANMDFVESKLGGVVVRYAIHDKKGDTGHQAREVDLHSLPGTGFNDNEQAQAVVGKTIELPLPTSTLLDPDISDETIVAESTVSTPPSPSVQAGKEAIASAPPFPHSLADIKAADSAPPSPSGQVEQADIAVEAVADSLGRNDHDFSSPSTPPPLSSSDEGGSMLPPPPPFSPPPATRVDESPLSSSAEPTLLVLLPPEIIAGEPVVDGFTDSRNDDIDGSYGDDFSTPYKKPPLSNSSELGSPAAPTPPLSSPSASSVTEPPQSPKIEPPSIALPAPTPPTPPPPPPLVPLPQPSQSTFSTNPLGDMFSPPLDQPDVIAVIKDILCSKRVTNDRRRAVRVSAELESGCISGENMEWVVRGLKTLQAKRAMKQRHGGLVFGGPRYAVPLYKTGSGVRRLLRGIAKKHGAGTNFVVCVSSNSGNTAADEMKMITGTISASASGSSASPLASGAARAEPVMDGDVPGLANWSNIRGNYDDGCRLWAWVY